MSTEVIIALYDSEEQKAFNGAIVAEQVQIGTQRMNGQAVIQDPNHNSLFMTVDRTNITFGRRITGIWFRTHPVRLLR